MRESSCSSTMRKKDLSTVQRNQVLQFILQRSADGKTKRGLMKEAVDTFHVSRSTVSRMWKATKKQEEDGQLMHIVSGKLTKIKDGPKKLDLDALTSLEYSKRGSMRTAAMNLGVSKSSLGRWSQAGLVRTHTSALKPDLTPANKLLRLRFNLASLELHVIENQIKFKNMHNVLHIDEKWFYLTRDTRRFYLTPTENDPHRTVKSKGFVPKLMFMCAVGRPIILENGEVLFDGKIGTFPFTKTEEAKRKCKYRDKGTLETKAIDSVTKAVIKDCLITQILPAIRQKWPQNASKDIMIQQDNARPHITDNDPDFRLAATEDGFNIKLVQQPPNSPDLNVNDLGWFRAIQSLQIETACKNVDELMNAVENSFNSLSSNTLNDVFLSLQGCMLEIMRVKGQNCYKIPHMGKNALRRTQSLPLSLDVPNSLASECIQHLVEMDSLEGIGDMAESLGIQGFEGY